MNASLGLSDILINQILSNIWISLYYVMNVLGACRSIPSNHTGHVTRTLWRLRSPETRLFVENGSSALQALCERNLSVTERFLPQTTSNAEHVSMSRRHYK